MLGADVRVFNEAARAYGGPLGLSAFDYDQGNSFRSSLEQVLPIQDAGSPVVTAEGVIVFEHADPGPAARDETQPIPHRMGFGRVMSLDYRVEEAARPAEMPTDSALDQLPVSGLRQILSRFRHGSGKHVPGAALQ